MVHSQETTQASPALPEAFTMLPRYLGSHYSRNDEGRKNRRINTEYNQAGRVWVLPLLHGIFAIRGRRQNEDKILKHRGSDSN